MDHHEETQLDHVPPGRAIIVHEVQCHGDVGVAVVTEQVVLEDEVDLCFINITEKNKNMNIYNITSSEI